MAGKGLDASLALHWYTTMTSVEPAGDSAYRQLRSLILAGDLTVEAPLSERGLAARLGLGRTPVRQAIKALVAQGLLAASPTRGAFLKVPSIDEVREIYEIRVALEGMAAVIVARRGADTAIRRFLAQFAAALEAGDEADLEPVEQSGWEFHDAVVAASGNRRMIDLHATLRLPIAVLRRGRPIDGARARRSLIEHHAIAKALVAGDPVLAQRLMTDHLGDILAARVASPALSTPNRRSQP